MRPLIKVIHPGELDDTHSSIEGGRDLVSFGQDGIGRTHILAVQTKASKISYGASFRSIAVLLETAKKTRAVGSNGNSAFPNEVWLISSTNFPEHKRRQVEDQVVDIEKMNVKMVFS